MNNFISTANYKSYFFFYFEKKKIIIKYKLAYLNFINNFFPIILPQLAFIFQDISNIYSNILGRKQIVNLSIFYHLNSIKKIN